jgi:transcriptional regulator GlxA family with amidase domain
MKSLKLWVAFVFVFMTGAAYADSKTIGVVVFDGVLTSDVTAPLEVFGVASKLSWFADYEVVTIGVNSAQQITTEEGLKIGVDAWIGDAPQLDVLLLPSSYSMEPLLKNKALIQFIQSHAKQVDWLASNCSGSFLLGEAGVLDGKKATTWAGGEADLQKAYSAIDVQFDTNVVVDGNVITSNGSVVSYQAALTLLKMMTSEGKANEVADTIQYARLSNQPY